MEEKLNTLQQKLKTIKNLNSAAELLVWDQRVCMPPGGAEARAEQLATLSALSHHFFTADEIGLLLDDLAGAGLEYDSDEAALVRVTRRDYDRARRVPPALVEEMSRAFSLGQEVWAKARAAQDFAQFQESLTHIVSLNQQLAEAYGYGDHIYDALLAEYEPGLTTAEVTQVLAGLKVELTPIVQAIAARAGALDDALLKQDYDETAQWDFGLIPLAAIGFDMERGRQDKSVHPFTASFSVNDVRITTRIHEDMFPSSLFSTLHEGGHALYEQNVAPALEGGMLAGGTSLSVHESQSRLWENVVGRSREFWQFYFSRLQQFFPAQLGGASLEDFYRAINKVEPSLIRVEADEITYNLHIILRFELEQDLLTGRLKVADLPAAWNAKMEAYLGLTPPNDALGVLQDIHWSAGPMGYFSTYTLGNILSLQFYQQALQEQPDLPAQIARGEFASLLAWFREKVHRHGRKFTTGELLERATGANRIEIGPYVAYIKRKFSEMYGL
jgi:carboxypeptidase Taq